MLLKIQTDPVGGAALSSRKLARFREGSVVSASFSSNLLRTISDTRQTFGFILIFAEAGHAGDQETTL